MIELSPLQQQAVELLCTAQVGILTGLPGSGKTTCVQTALDRIGRQERVVLAAPTGKAARRLAEVTARPAGTLHRLLGLQPGTALPAHPDTLPYDTVLVDEASMLDVELGATLCNALGHHTRLLLVGDEHQLPSVGPGAVLHDLLASGLVPTVALNEVHRAASNSWVFRAAPLILRGEFDYTETSDFQFISKSFTGAVTDAVSDVTCRLYAEHGGDNVQVLVPMNVGELGTAAINSVLQRQLNPAPSKETFSAVAAKGYIQHIGENDRVVCIANDYTRNVFNGELGTVITVEGRGAGSVLVRFDERTVEYTRTAAGDGLRLSYVLTPHKMQGSEADWVVLVLHTQHAPMLYRKLLYTAITRAKKGVVIVGQRAAISKALSVDQELVRDTTLLQRLEEYA